MCLALNEVELNFKDARWYATPRRLSLLITDLDITQKNKEHQRRGPSLSVAFDKNENPTQATVGFANSCGVEVKELEKTIQLKNPFCKLLNHTLSIGNFVYLKIGRNVYSLFTLD